MRLRRPSSLLLCAALLGGCATTSSSQPQQHGTFSRLSEARAGAAFCEHRVPAEACTRCHPELEARFRAAHDWCGEHGVPESQCYACHPDLSFEPLPELPASADLVRLSHAGEDVPELAAHAAPGKVTVFDFYADWCAACRKVDAHVFRLLQQRGDLAVRKLNVVSWETPLAERYLREVEALPLLVVYGKDGREVARVTGGDVAALDRALRQAGVTP